MGCSVRLPSLFITQVQKTINMLFIIYLLFILCFWCICRGILNICTTYTLLLLLFVGISVLKWLICKSQQSPSFLSWLKNYNNVISLQLWRRRGVGGGVRVLLSVHEFLFGCVTTDPLIKWLNLRRSTCRIRTHPCGLLLLQSSDILL